MLKMSGNKAELFLKMLREDDWEGGMEGRKEGRKEREQNKMELLRNVA